MSKLFLAYIALVFSNTAIAETKLQLVLDPEKIESLSLSNDKEEGIIKVVPARAWEISSVTDLAIPKSISVPLTITLSSTCLKLVKEMMLGSSPYLVKIEAESYDAEWSYFRPKVNLSIDGTSVTCQVGKTF